MKVLINKYNLINPRRSIVILSAVFFFSSVANAQNSRPTPTPRNDTPQIISRDEDLNTRPTDNDVNELSEIVESEDSTILTPPAYPKSTTESEVESSKKQKRMMLFLDLLTKTEQRAALLRQQVFDLLDKQNSVSAKIQQTDYLLRPEVIASATALTGSMRPEDLRTQRKETLELQKANLEAQLRQIETSRTNLEESLRKAELLVERIRSKFEQAVEDALNEDDQEPF